MIKRRSLSGVTFLWLLCFVSGILLSSIAEAASSSLGTWQMVNVGKPAKLFVSGVAYGNGYWVAVGQGGFIATSPDGQKWTKRSAGITRDFNGIAFSGGRFIAVCKAPDTGSGAKIWVSDDNGATWKFRNTDAGLDFISVGLHAVATDGNGSLIAVGGFGWITRSYDNGQTWHVLNPQPSQFQSNSLYGIAYGNGVWIATGNGNGVYRSRDGTNWTAVSTSIGSTSVTFGNGRFLMADNANNAVRWSSDGMTWTQSKATPAFGGSTSFSYPHGCTYFDGLFIVVTEYGNIWTSDNGRDLQLWRASGGDPDCWAVAGGNGQYVAVGGDFTLKYGTGWVSPPWLKARLGSARDYPYTLFDSDGHQARRMDLPEKMGLPQYLLDSISAFSLSAQTGARKIGLPEYQVNTSSLNLLLEGTLFFTPTLGAPVSIHLVYASSPVADGTSSIGLFGKNWHCQYESFVGQFGPDARLTTPGGRALLFSTPDGSDISAATSPVTLNRPDGVFDDLIYTPGTGFQYKEKSSRLTYQYGVAGGPGNALWRLTQITDRNGNAVSLTVVAGNGQISSITDPAGRTVAFSYNGQNLCTGITVPDGRKISFEYDTHSDLISLRDMAGYNAAYAYDDKGFLTKIITAGRVTSFSYSPRPGYEDATSAQANAGDLVVATVMNPAGGITRYQIQPGDGGVKRTDPKGTVVTFHSTQGQTTSVTDPLGAIRSLAYSNAKLPASFTSASGKITKFSYDARGNLTQTIDALGTTTEYAYDSEDNMISRQDALGKVTTMTYDANGRVTAVATPLGNHTSFAYFGNGRLGALKDALNNSTTFTYDVYGNLTQAADPLGGVEQFTYDGAGLRPISSTDPRGNVKSFAYDGNDRLTKTQYATVAGTPARTNSYDAFGQTSFTNEMSQTSAIERNEFGFITRLTDPVGNISMTWYDPLNNPVSIVDPLGRTTQKAYDAAGQATVITDQRGKQVRFDYDANGNMTGVTDETNNKTTLEYDANNRLIRTTDPLGKASIQARDSLGRVSTVTNARGDQILFTYDDDGRFTKKQFQLSGAVSPTTEATFQYDANGEVISRADRWGTTTYAYDANGRVASIGYPSGKSAAFTYNATGLPATVTYPNGLVVTYTYDSFNRVRSPIVALSGGLVGGSEPPAQVLLLQMVKSGTQQSIRYSYNSAALPTLTHRSNGIDTVYAYDGANRLATMTHLSGTAPVLKWDSSFDAASNLLSVATSGSLALVDPLPDIATLSYDKCNQVTKRNGEIYLYDADGDLTGIPDAHFTASYLPDSRLSQISRPAAGGAGVETVTYTYDGNGLRVKRAVTGGATTQFHYGPDDRLLFTTDGAGSVLACYIWKGATVAAILTGSNISTDLRYPLLNYLGNVMAVTDGTGAAEAQYAYQPYGGYTRQARAGATDPGLLTFVGGLGVQDEGGGLFYMKNRFYDSVTGRFLQRDPAALDGGSNLYAYSRGNPLNLIDPGGLWSFPWDGLQKVAAVTAGVITAGAVIASAPVSLTVAAVSIGTAAFVGTGVSLGVEAAKDLAGNQTNYTEAAKTGVVGGVLGAGAAWIGGGSAYFRAVAASEETVIGAETSYSVGVPGGVETITMQITEAADGIAETGMQILKGLFHVY